MGAVSLCEVVPAEVMTVGGVGFEGGRAVWREGTSYSRDWQGDRSQWAIEETLDILPYLGNDYWWDPRTGEPCYEIYAESGAGSWI